MEERFETLDEIQRLMYESMCTTAFFQFKKCEELLRLAQERGDNKTLDGDPIEFEELRLKACKTNYLNLCRTHGVTPQI